MDYESLIADLQKICQMNSISHYKRDVCAAAATALSTLQAENAQLRESRDHWKRLAHELSEGVNGKDAEHERLQAENEKLRAELEQVKREHDAAVKDLNEFLAMDELCPIQCEWCKWNGTYCDGKNARVARH